LNHLDYHLISRRKEQTLALPIYNSLTVKTLSLFPPTQTLLPLDVRS